jgi:general secretion pathway protein K
MPQRGARRVDRNRHRKCTQHGAAIITALLVVMLAATIASYLLAQQSAALTRTARTSDRAQIALYAQPALDWARAALTASLKGNSYVHNKQPWAQGLTQPIEDAIASGVLRDEAARFNVNNLVLDDGTRSPADVDIFERLLKKLSLDPALSSALLDWIDKDSELTPNGAEDSFYLGLASPYRAANRRLSQIDELARVRGFDSNVLRRLTPYVSALPARTKLNVNTALPEVMAATFPSLSDDDIATIVRAREELPFKATAELKSREETKKIPVITIDQFAEVNSSYFLATIAITRESAQLTQTALLQRAPSSATGVASAGGTPWPAIIWAKLR